MDLREELDMATADTVEAETQEALNAVAAKHGMTVIVSGGSWSPQEGMVSPKVVFALEGAGRREFESGAKDVGFEPEDYGRTFEFEGRTLKVTGLRLRAKRQRVRVADVEDGRAYRIEEEVVLKALGRLSPDVLMEAGRLVDERVGGLSR